MPRAGLGCVKLGWREVLCCDMMCCRCGAVMLKAGGAAAAGGGGAPVQSRRQEGAEVCRRKRQRVPVGRQLSWTAGGRRAV